MPQSNPGSPEEFFEGIFLEAITGLASRKGAHTILEIANTLEIEDIQQLIDKQDVACCPDEGCAKRRAFNKEMYGLVMTLKISLNDLMIKHQDLLEQAERDELEHQLRERRKHNRPRN